MLTVRRRREKELKQQEQQQPVASLMRKEVKFRNMASEQKKHLGKINPKEINTMS